tara:strand:+ start:1779 stop:2216 length:438 start_codon:yes stop_codon:yes gene_type:complete
METHEKVKKQMRKRDLPSLEERVFKLEEALTNLTRNMVTSFASSVKVDQELHSNQESLAKTHDGLADRMFGFIDLLRALGPEYAEHLSDENLVNATNAWIQRRADQELAQQEMERQKALEKGVTEEPTEPPADEDIPEGATVFGG